MQISLLPCFGCDQEITSHVQDQLCSSPASQRQLCTGCLHQHSQRLDSATPCSRRLWTQAAAAHPLNSRSGTVAPLCPLSEVCPRGPDLGGSCPVGCPPLQQPAPWLLPPGLHLPGVPCAPALHHSLTCAFGGWLQVPLAREPRLHMPAIKGLSRCACIWGSSPASCCWGQSGR